MANLADVLQQDQQILYNNDFYHIQIKNKGLTWSGDF